VDSAVEVAIRTRELMGRGAKAFTFPGLGHLGFVAVKCEDRLVHWYGLVNWEDELRRICTSLMLLNDWKQWDCYVR
jgi:hypothetical protein